MAEIEQFLSKDAEKQVNNLVILMADLAANYEKSFKASKKLDDQIKKTSKSTKTEVEKRKELTAIEKEEARILKATEATKAKLQTISTASNKLLVREQELLKKKNKELRAATVETGKLEGAFRKLNNRRTEAAKRLKDLIASERASTKEIQKAQRAFDQLDKKVQKANRSARQFQSNVGNYPKLFGASTRALGGFLSAFGLVGGIALFARSITDAFKRIREFDKSIVELSGVLGKSRKEIIAIEKEIIRVSGASTKTSGEVANLATALATLGSTEAEVLKLIKPVNDLSIALNATSEEAGELLKGTLNAFQASSSEALRFADVIAKMRTSTALNFERIKDSLGFIAPTAKAVGLSIEGLGARIGVLVNNNVKAARAGRLLNTSFLRLAGNGKTLEDALDEINEAQLAGADSTKILSIAGDLFGKQAAGLGLILADNRDKVAELTKEFENAGGTLKELTDNQLTSIDAKLKILDSTWETLILTITAGDNAIGRDFKGSVQTLTGWIQKLSDAIGGVDRRFENWKEGVLDMGLSSDQVSRQVQMLTDKLVEQQAIVARNEEQGILDPSGRKEDIRGFEKQLAFLKILENQAKEADEAELDRLAKIEAEKDRIKQLALDAEIKARIEANKKIAAENKKLADFNHDLTIKGVESTKSQFLQEVEAKVEQNEILKRQEEKLRNDLFEINENARKEQEAAEEKILADQKVREEARRAIITASVDLVAEIFTGFQDLRIQQLSDESNALELQRQTQLENAAGDKEKEAQINAQFDKKQAVIKQKQWKAEQNAALFQIAIQSGVNAVKAFSGGPVLIALALALGIAQAAFVKAQKPPKFAKGSKGLQKDTHGVVGDAGRELLFMPGGGVALAQNETEGVFPKGTVIKTNRETEQILAANQLKASRENESAARNYGELAILSQSIADDRKSILKAVSDRDQYLFNVSKQGVINMSKRNKSGTTTYLNNRFR